MRKEDRGRRWVTGTSLGHPEETLYSLLAPLTP